MLKHIAIQNLLRNAIRNRLACEYLAPGASPAKRSYHEGRIVSLLRCLTDEPSEVLALAVKQYKTEHHAPGDDITYPEGTSVQGLIGRIQAAQDVIAGEGEQQYDSPVRL